MIRVLTRRTLAGGHNKLKAYRWATTSEEETVKYDVCIVGGGPAGLSAAIRTKQLAKEMEKDVKVCVLDKGGEIGAHIISGCVLDPRSLNELLPKWKESLGQPSWLTAAKKDRMYFLTKERSWRLPVLPPMGNKGCYIVSLSALCRWLATQAEELGVDLYPGFAAAEVLRNSDGSIGGVQTRDRGLDKNGNRKSKHEPGISIKARVTLLAEGCRGSISEEVMDIYRLRQDAEHQTYGLGIKEVWKIPAEQHSEGLVVHSVGFPLEYSTYGGGFLYHMPENRVAVGLVVGLDYRNPYLSVFQEFQRFKRHKLIKDILQGGECLQYGARTLNEGGLQCLPRLDFPGGALVGCSAGFMNSMRLKGTHGAMKSGMLAAETLVGELSRTEAGSIPMADYTRRFQNSWLNEELQSVRNVRPMFRNGLYVGMLSALLHGSVLRGREPWTFKHRHEDHTTLLSAKEAHSVLYEAPDRKLTFDVASSLHLSCTDHEPDQPAHLRVRNKDTMEHVNVTIFDKPETRYCPAGVYDYLSDENGKEKLLIQAQNCLHCKACDIKDPLRNIQWTVPDGGGGPNYTIM